VVLDPRTSSGRVVPRLAGGQQAIGLLRTPAAIFQGTFLTSAGLYVAGLRRLTAATAATLLLAEPLVATALGIGILRERLSLPIAAGALPLLGGLVLVSVPRPRAGSRPQPPASSPPVSAEPSERPVKAGSSTQRTKERVQIRLAAPAPPWPGLVPLPAGRPADRPPVAQGRSEGPTAAIWSGILIARRDSSGRQNILFGTA